MMKRLFVAVVFVCLCVVSSGVEAGTKVAKQYGVPALPREAFNRLAVSNGVPLYWEADSNGSSTVEAGEVVSVGAGSSTSPYIEGGAFTSAFRDAYLKMVEAYRKELVEAELDFGRPTLVASDFRGAPKGERELVDHIVQAGKIIDKLYQRQKGGLKYLPEIPAGDTASLALYERNEGPWCEAPKTLGNPHCNAVSSFPPKTSDAYPEKMQLSKNMCESLGKRKDAKELLNPFTVVRMVKGKPTALPLTDVYGDEMSKVSKELVEAVGTLGKNEEAFRKYLMAAAEGFETNDWADADEAWVGMNARNSKWYLRVAPDETYFDPCSEKAGFHVAFAKIDSSSLKWQDILNPLRQEMEDLLSDLVGPSYESRKVAFNFPDFIEIILNTGDSRHSLGAIIGQSLPNWGKVAEEGRRRTVVMTNLYTDPDSKKTAVEKASMLLDPESMKYYSEDKEISLVDIILHEATHNFGPHTDYKVNGKTPSEIFGGRMSSILEELKAQTGSLWYVDFLRKKGIISANAARELYTHAINWCFGHISRGLFTESGNPKAYAQLSAIQVGSLMEDGALSFVSSTDPVSGETMDRFRIDYEKMPGAVEKLMKRVGTIMATGDAAGAAEMIDYYVKGEGSKPVHMKEIADRLLKFPKESFYYSVRY